MQMSIQFRAILPTVQAKPCSSKHRFPSLDAGFHLCTKNLFDLCAWRNRWVGSDGWLFQRWSLRSRSAQCVSHKWCRTARCVDFKLNLTHVTGGFKMPDWFNLPELVQLTQRCFVVQFASATLQKLPVTNLQGQLTSSDAESYDSDAVPPLQRQTGCQW